MGKCQSDYSNFDDKRTDSIARRSESERPGQFGPKRSLWFDVLGLALMMGFPFVGQMDSHIKTNAGCNDMHASLILIS